MNSQLVTIHTRLLKGSEHAYEQAHATMPLEVQAALRCPGIFLLGGSKRSDASKEIVLEPGDVLVMSGKSRMKFHGFKGITRGNKRLNLTIRQVY